MRALYKRYRNRCRVANEHWASPDPDIAPPHLPLLFRKEEETHLEHVGQRRLRGGEDAEPVVRGAALFRELEKLVQWRTAGLLSEEEFRQAKAKLLG